MSSHANSPSQNSTLTWTIILYRLMIWCLGSNHFQCHSFIVLTDTSKQTWNKPEAFFWDYLYSNSSFSFLTLLKERWHKPLKSKSFCTYFFFNWDHKSIAWLTDLNGNALVQFHLNFYSKTYCISASLRQGWRSYLWWFNKQQLQNTHAIQTIRVYKMFPKKVRVTVPDSTSYTAK